MTLQVLSFRNGIEPFLPGFREGQAAYGLIAVVDLTPVRRQSPCAQAAQRRMRNAVITNDSVYFTLLHTEIKITQYITVSVAKLDVVQAQYLVHSIPPWILVKASYHRSKSVSIFTRRLKYQKTGAIIVQFQTIQRGCQ